MFSEFTYKPLSNFERNSIFIRESIQRSAVVITCALQKEKFAVPEKLENIYTLHRFVIIFLFLSLHFIHILFILIFLLLWQVVNVSGGL